MTKEEMIVKLDSMLSEPKKRNFLNHLVRSYVPINKVEKESYTKDNAPCCHVSGFAGSVLPLSFNIQSETTTIVHRLASVSRRVPTNSCNVLGCPTQHPNLRN
jgi:hypothetical protein